MRKKLKGITTFFIIGILLLISCTPGPEKEAYKAESRAIHERILTVDTHCDTPMRMVRGEWDIGERHQPGERGSGCIDLPRMAEGGLDAEFFAVFVGQGERTSEGYERAKQRAREGLDAIHRMCEDYPDLVELATIPEDAYRLEKEGKRAAFIGLENGYPIGRDLSLLKEYYGRGVRYITLCHGEDNDICDSSTDERNPEDNGLSDFGRDVVAECNRLGIMIDVSHISDKSFFDVLEVTTAPVIASHSNLRTLCDHPRNLSDEMLKALAENGGVVQISLVSSFIKKTKPNQKRNEAIAELRRKYGRRSEIQDEETRARVRQEYQEIYEKYPSKRATVKHLVNHIDYVVKLVGIDHVGIGTDFDGGGELQDCADVTELPQITEELVRRGYTEEDIRKIWGGNIMRVLGVVMEKAEKDS